MNLTRCQYALSVYVVRRCRYMVSVRVIGILHAYAAPSTSFDAPHGGAKMRIVMDRGYCDAALPFCARCSAAYFQKPEGTDRPCIVAIEDDGKDDVLHFVLLTDDRSIEFDLTEELQEGLALEGWEFLADFDPGFFRTGAADKWRALSELQEAA